MVVSMLIFSCKQKQGKSVIPIKDQQTIENIDSAKIPVTGLEEFIDEKINEMKVPGLSMVIINEGKIVYHLTKGYADIEEKQPVTKQTLFEGASISKPVFAYLIMKLVDEGKLGLDKPLHQYLDHPFPGLDSTDKGYKEITARMVLSHSTGFPNWRGNAELSTKFKPGTAFGYSGEGYQYLVHVVQSILDTDYIGLEAYFHEKVAVTFKMAHTTYLPNSYSLKKKATPHKNGENLPKKENTQEFNAAAGIHTEALEYSQWLIGLMNKQGLTKENYKELFADQIVTPKSEWFNEVDITHWTLGFAKHEFEFLNTPIYGHIGNNEGFTSLFLMDLDKKWGMVLFTNADQADDFGFDVFKYMNEEN